MRAVVRGGDPGATRHRLDRALRSLDLEPAGLPTGALLCVRRLADPLPGRLAATEREAAANARWSQAARDSLGTSLATAARPLAGRLPARAEAVLFPSEADLLACFALAQAEGRLATEWWWASALPPEDCRLAWPELWSRHSALIPAALQHLASGPDLNPVLRTLPPVAAGMLNRRLAVSYGLPGLLAVLSQKIIRAPAQASSRHPSATIASSTRPAYVSPPPADPVDSRFLVPTISWPELTDLVALPSEPALFGLLGLLLARIPALVRQPSFLVTARAVLDGTFPRILREPPATTVRPDASPVAVPEAKDPTANYPVHPAIGGPPPIRPAELSPADAAAPPASRSSPAPVESNRPAFQRAAPPKEICVPLVAPVVATVTTKHGGVFYLLNLALALGLYGDFTQPLRPGLALSPWEFLGLLGRRLLRESPETDADPLWPLLARLAGPPGTPAGSWTDLADWEPDPDWTDQPLSLPPTARTSVEGFVDWLIPVLTNRLDRAGVALPVLLGPSARVVVTAERVDVHFALSAHPIEIRLAGLDRDPGWIPAAGRDVRYHYA